MVVRDRRGKMPLDVAKDEQVKAIIRQSATTEGRALKKSTSVASTSTTSPGSGNDQIQAQQNQATPPVMKG